MARLPRTTSRCRDGLSKAEQFWSALRRLLGLGTGVREWDTVHAVIDGLATIDGVVDYLTPEFFGIRGHSDLYRFIYAPGGMPMVEHHEFSARPDGHLSAEAWRGWLAKVFESTESDGPVRKECVR